MKRILTGLILTGILIPLACFEELYLGFQLVMFLAMSVATFEMIKVFGKDGKFSIFAKIIIYLGTCMIFFGGLSWGAGMGVRTGMNDFLGLSIRQSVSYMLILIAVLSVLALSVIDRNFDGRMAGQSLLIIFYVGIGFSSLVILRAMGIRFVVYVFLITTMADMFAYFFGMRFGAHKMIPHISPKKSWEGAILGSLIATVVSSLFAGMYGDLFNDPIFGNILSSFSISSRISHVWQITIIVVMSFVATIISQIGDLVASRIKRTYDAKDFGKIFPGHGGVMDRLDSVIFTSTFLLACFLLIETVSQVVGA